MNIDEARECLERNQFIVSPASNHMVVYSHKGEVAVVCSRSRSEEELVVSISFGLQANLRQAKKWMNALFGGYHEHLSQYPTDGKIANYFSLK